MPSRTLLLLCLLAVGLAGPRAASAQPAELPLVTTIDMQGDVNTAGGLAYSSNLWTGDYISPDNSDTDLLAFHTFAADGTVLNTYTVPKTAWPDTPTGAAINPKSGMAYLTYFSSSPDTLNPGIACFKPGSNNVSIVDFQGPEADVRTKGLAHDGTYLWQAHYSPDTGHLYAIDTATNTRVNDLAVGAYPVGVDYDGRYFYVAHFDWSTYEGSISKYDRAGTLLTTYALPPEMSDIELGDIAVSGNNLYVHEAFTNSVAQLQLPAATGSPKPLPAGVRAIGVKNEVATNVIGVNRSDSQTANSLDDMPSAASLHQIAHNYGDYYAAAKAKSPAAAQAGDSSGISADGGATEVWTVSRSWLDGSDQLHHSLHSLAWGLNNLKPLTGDASVTLVKDLEPVPVTPSRPAGTPVNARGTLTLNGTVILERDSIAPDPNGLSAFLDVRVAKTTGELCFSGRIGLEGVSNPRPGEDWAQVVMLGDFSTAGTTPAAFASRSATASSFASQPWLTIDSETAQLDLDMLTFPVGVPVNTGQGFSVAFTFSAHSTVPTMAGGMGAEVLMAMGESAVLTPGYYPPEDAVGYSDGYGYGYAAAAANGGSPVPEPICLMPLALGLLALRRRGGHRS